MSGGDVVKPVEAAISGDSEDIDCGAKRKLCFHKLDMTRGVYATC